MKDNTSTTSSNNSFTSSGNAKGTTPLVVHEYPFPINRWIEPNRLYVFTMYDSVLPQFDQNPAQRKVEMDEKRERYGLKGNCEEAPKQVCLFVITELVYIITTFHI